MKKELQIAEEASSNLYLRVVMHSMIYGLDLKDIPVTKEVQPLVGFLSAAADVCSQSLGGKAGGNGSVNATLRLYQSIFPEEKIVDLMELTFLLHSNPTPAFEAGLMHGATFGNGIVLDDLNRTIRAAMNFFPEFYRAYCSNPEGKHPSDA